MNEKEEETIFLERYLVSQAELFSGFSWGNGSIDGKAIKMIETLGICPGRKMFFAQLHEFFLKFGNRLRGVRVARRHHATLAGIVAEKFYRADLKWLQFARCSK